MAEYDAVVQCYINRNVVQIIFLVVVALICIILIWAIPVLRSRFSDSHKPGGRRHSHRSRKERFTAYVMKRDTFFIQVVLTAVCLILLVPALQCFDRISDLKSDIQNGTYLTYEGSYSVQTMQDTAFFNKIFGDPRSVSVNGRTAPLQCDMQFLQIEINNGGHKGTVVYGQKSGVVVKITKQ